jgi:hypothetical protein
VVSGRALRPEVRKLLAWMARGFFCAAASLALGDYVAMANERLAAARILASPDMPEPGYLEPVTDPIFGTWFTRVTNPGRQLLVGVSCRPSECRHRYSSAQAWNSDQSLLVIARGCPGLCFLDGQSYAPAFHRRVSGACEWHTTDPALMICVQANRIYAWAVRTNKRTTLFASSEYRKLRFGPSKGNLSNDSNRLVVRATNSAGTLVAFAYDIATATKYPDIDLSKLEGRNSYCTIAPSGQFILCFQRLPDRTNTSYVFTLDGVQQQYWGENHRPGHGDMTIDSDGSDVYVGISKDRPDKHRIIKRRLADGVVTVLTPVGQAQHASIRNIRRLGWVFVTYGGTPSKVMARKSWAPFYQEIVAMRIDGSGEIRRIVQTRSAKHDYTSEAQASPSPDASQVIWSSNWGRAGQPVSAYVARLSWPREGGTAQLPGHRGSVPECGGDRDCPGGLSAPFGSSQEFSTRRTGR